MGGSAHAFSKGARTSARQPEGHGRSTHNAVGPLPKKARAVACSSNQCGTAGMCVLYEVAVRRSGAACLAKTLSEVPSGVAHPFVRAFHLGLVRQVEPFSSPCFFLFAP